MYQRRRARVLLAVLSLVALVLITVDFRAGDDGGVLDRVRDLATAAFAPAQDGLAALIRPIGDAAASVGDLFDARAEVAALRERLDRLQERRRSATDIERENERLRGLLDMRDRVDVETLAAHVIALSPSNFSWEVTLDVGAQDGVARDMPVVNGDGLVGRVIQVTPRASRVLLAIDPTFGAAARVARSGETGTLDGRGGGLMRMRPLDPEADIRPGDEIVTAGYENGLFPPGIPIGTVETVGEATTALDREVQVRPFVDFTRLDLVLVLLHTPGEEVPGLDDVGDIPFTPPNIPDEQPSPSPSPFVTPTAPASPPEGEG